MSGLKIDPTEMRATCRNCRKAFFYVRRGTRPRWYCDPCVPKVNQQSIRNYRARQRQKAKVVE